MRIYTTNGTVYILDETLPMKVEFYVEYSKTPKREIEKHEALYDEYGATLQKLQEEFHKLNNKSIKTRKQRAVLLGLEREVHVVRYDRRACLRKYDDDEAYYRPRIRMCLLTANTDLSFKYSELEPVSLEEILETFFYLTTDEALNNISREKQVSAL